MSDSENSRRIAALEDLVRGLQKQVSALMNGSTRAPVDIPYGECHLGNDPTSCAGAKPYRYQKGCRAEACQEARRGYYGQHAHHKANGVAVTANGKPVEDTPVQVRRTQPSTKKPTRKLVKKSAAAEH